MQLKNLSEGRDFPDFQNNSPLLTLDLYHVFRIMNFQTIYAKNITLYWNRQTFNKYSLIDSLKEFSGWRAL